MFAEVSCGRHGPSKLLEHLRRGLPRTSGQKLIVFLGLVVVIPASDDLTRKTLEIIGAIIVWGVLHGILCSELLHHEVREMVDPVEDPERYQGCIAFGFSYERLTSKFNSASLKNGWRGNRSPLIK